MAIATTDGRFLQVNRALCSFTGRAPDELEGTPIARLRASRRARGGGGVARAPGARRRRVGARRAALAARRRDDRVGRDQRHPRCATSTCSCRSRTSPSAAATRPSCEYLADHDPLTGIFNRRGCSRAREAQLAHGRRPAGEAALVLDLDHLKDVNDSRGHAAGDKLIAQRRGAIGPAPARVRRASADWAATSSRCCSPTPAPTTPRRSAHHLIDRGRRAPPRHRRSRRVQVTTTIGAATAPEAGVGRAWGGTSSPRRTSRCTRPRTRDAIASRSATGRSGAAQARARLSGDAARAPRRLRDDAFELHWQPIVDLESGHVSEQYEVLLRLPERAAGRCCRRPRSCRSPSEMGADQPDRPAGAAPRGRASRRPGDRRVLPRGQHLGPSMANPGRASSRPS